jgi:hypothetical protein
MLVILLIIIIFTCFGFEITVVNNEMTVNNENLIQVVFV